MINTMRAWIAKYPVKLGMALQWFGTYLMGAGSIFAVGSVQHHWWVGPTIVLGFFLSGFGGFIALLFTNGRSVEIQSPVIAQTMVQTTLQSVKPVDIPMKTEVTASS
jgi:hypothetical protein